MNPEPAMAPLRPLVHLAIALAIFALNSAVPQAHAQSPDPLLMEPIAENLGGEPFRLPAVAPLETGEPAFIHTGVSRASFEAENLAEANMDAKPKAKAKDPITKILTPLTSECGDITFKPGLRVQSRYMYDNIIDDNDFMIRRFRLKAGGDAYKLATYGLELKIDNTGRFGVPPQADGTAASPKAQVENAWLDFTIFPEATFLRVGLYDAPFSRDALTSDSKLLFMDRTLVKERLLDPAGFTDNTVGLMLHGRPGGGRWEYMFGVFDNLILEAPGFAANNSNSNQLMPMGRVVLNLLDPATPPSGYADYMESYLGEGQRLNIGTNVGYLGNASRTLPLPAGQFDQYAWGVDLFFNTGPWTLTLEYDWLMEDLTNGNPDRRGDGWYIQGGYLLGCCCGSLWEAVARYQGVDVDDNIPTDRTEWTSVGMNIYIREHNLKIQTDYTFKNEQVELDNDTVQIQLQLDY